MLANRTRRIQAIMMAVDVMVWTVLGGIAGGLWQAWGLVVSLPLTIVGTAIVTVLVLEWGRHRGGWIYGDF